VAILLPCPGWYAKELQCGYQPRHQLYGQRLDARKCNREDCFENIVRIANCRARRRFHGVSHIAFIKERLSNNTLVFLRTDLGCGNQTVSPPVIQASSNFATPLRLVGVVPSLFTSTDTSEIERYCWSCSYSRSRRCWS
jgi:hypothetical protein